ncbi:hypothetical protein A3Q56_03230 [Intoshia linei]|uniref:Uncharacterized protein n=1 Tax=Intoshia linei TaxID=1819745 RepID=A0A177B406_9BILA|nr:hypothetical protein A3Q56_03230 [Intoshia linei]
MLYLPELVCGIESKFINFGSNLWTINVVIEEKNKKRSFDNVNTTKNEKFQYKSCTSKVDTYNSKSFHGKKKLVKSRPSLLKRLSFDFEKLRLKSCDHPKKDANLEQKMNARFLNNINPYKFTITQHSNLNTTNLLTIYLKINIFTLSGETCLIKDRYNFFFDSRHNTMTFKLDENHLENIISSSIMNKEKVKYLKKTTSNSKMFNKSLIKKTNDDCNKYNYFSEMKSLYNSPYGKSRKFSNNFISCQEHVCFNVDAVFENVSNLSRVRITDKVKYTVYDRNNKLWNMSFQIENGSHQIIMEYGDGEFLENHHIYTCLISLYYLLPNKILEYDILNYQTFKTYKKVDGSPFFCIISNNNFKHVITLQSKDKDLILVKNIDLLFEWISTGMMEKCTNLSYKENCSGVYTNYKL